MRKIFSYKWFTDDMAVYISFLRGINVAGHASITMKQLVEAYCSLSLKHVQTHLQSGNVVFESQGSNVEVLGKKLENAIEQKTGLKVGVIIRTPAHIKWVLDNNVFRIKEKNEALYVTFLSCVPEASLVKNIDRTAFIPDEFCVVKDQIFLYCPNGYGRTKLSNVFFERKLKCVGTTRNWNTINAVYELAGKKRG